VTHRYKEDPYTSTFFVERCVETLKKCGARADTVRPVRRYDDKRRMYVFEGGDALIIELFTNYLAVGELERHRRRFRTELVVRRLSSPTCRTAVML